MHAVYSPRTAKKLKKTTSLICNLDDHDSTPSPSFEAKFYAGEEQQFKLKWGRLQKAVFELYRSVKIKRKESETIRFPKGTLTILHDDVQVLIRSKAGRFILDFLEKRILPIATRILYEEIIEQTLIQKLHSTDNSTGNNVDLDVSNVVRVWKHFYGHVLPDLEMIFAQVRNESQETARALALIAFRDIVILKLETEIQRFLDQSATLADRSSLRQMFLVLQGVCEKYPPSENKLRLEKLVAQTVSPFQGHRGLYRNFSCEPDVISNEIDVAHLRRLSVVDPRKLTRPLSVHSNKPVETLQDLFALSADRNKLRGKNGSKGERKRSVSISEDFITGSFGF